MPTGHYSFSVDRYLLFSLHPPLFGVPFIIFQRQLPPFSFLLLAATLKSASMSSNLDRFHPLLRHRVDLCQGHRGEESFPRGGNLVRL